MNKQNLPWSREWEQMDLDLEQGRKHDAIMLRLLYLLAFVGLCMVGAVVLTDGLDRTAALEQARAEGARMGRLELLQQVKHEAEREGLTWLAFYRAASKAGISGFDGVVLVENRQ